MKARELDIRGAREITPAIHGDSRGLIFEWLTDTEFTAFAGHRLNVRLASCSVSSAGVLRGLHFAQLPPSQARYVTCVSGSVFDVVVDIHLGSPTFGSSDSVLLDDSDQRTIYISEGLAHATRHWRRSSNGRITRWDDPAIKALNNEEMPSEPIYVVFRSNASATTDNFHLYLNAAPNGAWGKRAGKVFNGGVGQGAAGNEGTSAMVKDNDDAITYNEWLFAQAQRLFAARIVTSVGKATFQCHCVVTSI
jgi:dTDP-4-dehydrorhamnose 3,5-epimerase-like enzyme